MYGKELRIASNDLYGNVDERKAVVFACFIHKKYMNRYVIFCFKDEYDKKKLYYGSIHLKNNSLIVFSVKDNVYGYIEEFTSEYLNNKVNSLDYELIDISNISKVELVSYNSVDFDKLEMLDKISIPRVSVNEEVKEKKPVVLYGLLIILLSLLGGITYLYFNPQAFSVEYKTLSCYKEEYNSRLLMKYDTLRELTFTKESKIKSFKGTDVYTFLDIDTYNSFKNENMQEVYFNIDGGYKYNDEELTLKIFYDEVTIIEDYQEILEYLEKDGYTCDEGSYYE